ATWISTGFRTGCSRVEALTGGARRIVPSRVRIRPQGPSDVQGLPAAGRVPGAVWFAPLLAVAGRPFAGDARPERSPALGLRCWDPAGPDRRQYSSQATPDLATRFEISAKRRRIRRSWHRGRWMPRLSAEP